MTIKDLQVEMTYLEDIRKMCVSLDFDINFVDFVDKHQESIGDLRHCIEAYLDMKIAKDKEIYYSLESEEAYKFLGVGPAKAVELADFSRRLKAMVDEFYENVLLVKLLEAFDVDDPFPSIDFEGALSSI